MTSEDAQAEAALVAFGHKRPETSRRPVLTLHLPLEMSAVGRVLQLAAELWPGAAVGEPTAQGDVVVEAELPHLVEQPRQPEPEAATFTAGAEKWLIPSWAEPPREGERVSSCRSCQAPVLWVTTNSGRKAPINADGTSHFATCPQADAWRRR